MLLKISKREGIVIIIALVILSTGLYYLNYYQPTREEIGLLQTQIHSLETEYKMTFNLVRNRLPDILNELARVQEDYQGVVELFPQKDNAGLLRKISDLATEQGIILDFFSPKSIINRGAYSQLPVYITFFSSYVNMMTFIMAIDHTLQQIQIVDLDVKSSDLGKGILQVNLLLNIYFVQK